MPDVTAVDATPAHATVFFARFQTRDDGVQPIANLLESLTHRDDELIIGHRID
jgi:hypothetical protein